MALEIDAEALAALSPERRARFLDLARVAYGRSEWLATPTTFATELIRWPEGQRLYPYQAAVLDALRTHHRVAMRSLHGAGKTSTTAIAVLWFALWCESQGWSWKILTTAGAWRQLSTVLWPEIHLWAARIDWDKLGRQPFDRRSELLTEHLKLRHGQASPGASDDPQLLEGVHADKVLLVLDEAKAIAAGVFDALEGAMAVGETFALATSTPGDPVGRFYDICQRRPGTEDWFPCHVTFAKALECRPELKVWAQQRKLQWGETSALYQNRVLGEFASSDEDAVIPLSWLDLAVERWKDWDAQGRLEPPGRRVVGVDVARFGADKTVLCSRQGGVVLEVERHTRQDTMETCGLVVGKLIHPGSIAVVDSIGIGAGVLDRLWEQKRPATGFNASERSERRDRTGSFGFINKRAEGWWQLREMLDPSGDPDLCIPPDDELLGELTAPKFKTTSAGKLQVEGKDDIRRRLGRSTDAADALIQTLLIPGVPAAGLSVAVRWSGGRLDPSGRTTALPRPAVPSPELQGRTVLPDGRW